MPDRNMSGPAKGPKFLCYNAYQCPLWYEGVPEIGFLRRSYIILFSFAKFNVRNPKNKSNKYYKK
jgi:hypothetical protein